MARARRKRKTRSKSWKSCPGVNTRTGRLKKGYRARKGGGCPVKVRK